jgi:hypothetical protein
MLPAVAEQLRSSVLHFSKVGPRLQLALLVQRE